MHTRFISFYSPWNKSVFMTAVRRKERIILRVTSRGIRFEILLPLFQGEKIYFYREREREVLATEPGVLTKYRNIFEKQKKNHKKNKKKQPILFDEYYCHVVLCIRQERRSL